MLLEPNYTAFILKFKTIHYHRKSRLKVYTATEIAMYLVITLPKRIGLQLRFATDILSERQLTKTMLIT